MLALVSADLVCKARKGDPKAVLQVIEVLKPHLKKRARMVRDDDAYSDLIVWLLKALRKYRGPLRPVPEVSRGFDVLMPSSRLL